MCIRDRHQTDLSRLDGHVRADDRRLAGRNSENPQRPSDIPDNPQLFVDISVRVGDQMSHGHLLAGNKFLYNPLFILKFHPVALTLNSQK